MTPFSLPIRALDKLRSSRPARVPALVSVLLPLLVTGCYRATGLTRNPEVAEVIPETAGDRVPGLKAIAGPGDYYLANDNLEVAVDGTPFVGALRAPLAGARSGGSIVDAGYITLDTSYRRISAPCDVLYRMTPVVNQDPDLQMVFNTYKNSNPGGFSYLVMEGQLVDPNHSISGATWGAGNVVEGVTITHTLSLAALDHFLTEQTVVTNTSGAALGIFNIGDCLLQSGAVGFRFAVPATYDVNGNVLNPRWGIQIPGSDFSKPLGTAVLAPEVGLLGTETGSATMDAHVALGIMPMDADNLLVTCDAQDAFTELRPQVPQRLVAGSLATTGLAAGASMTYNRRLYFVGGASSGSAQPSGTNGIFNLMDADKLINFRNRQYGWFEFNVAGTGVRQGPVPCEIRIETNVGTTSSPIWQLARVEYMEPNNSIVSASGFPSSTLNTILPAGNYRVVARNRTDEYIKTSFTNSWVNSAATLDNLTRYQPGPVLVQPRIPFIASSLDYLSPETASVVDSQGIPITSLYSLHAFGTHERDSPAGNLQPLRFTFIGTNGTPNPSMRRMVNFDSVFSGVNRGPAVAISRAAFQYQVRAGNMMFGTAFTNIVGAEYAWFPNPPLGSSAQNTYTAYGTRGPLSYLMSQPVAVFDGQTDAAHAFTVFPMGLPANWTNFDLPGPSQATTGGYGSAERLVSAMAEGVQVVAATELDVAVDPVALYNNFHFGYYWLGLYPSQRVAALDDILRLNTANGNDPYVVGARTANLTGYGTATALFTPEVTQDRFGGAQPSTTWTLADFLTQAGGSYNIVNRPCGPNGLFTEMQFDPTVPLGTGVNSWWTGTGPLAFGKTHGGFDALELIHAEGFDGSNPDPWFSEFQQVRADWFAILNQQGPTSFTKGLGLSGALYSLDTPVGLARTYLKTSVNNELDLTSVRTALQAGAAVASTGPFLGVDVNGTGPGGLVTGPMATANLNVSLTMTDWMPVDELRVIVNGVQVPVTLNGVQLTSIPPSALTQSVADPTIHTGTLTVPMPSASKGAWIVVEAGVRLDTTGPYQPGTPWNLIMMGMYPIAITNPIFVDVTGAGYTAPGL
jgi:hypothetical protein